MRNHTFYIVVREKDINTAIARNGRSFAWHQLRKLNADILEYTDRVLYSGWEFADNIEYTDYQEAKAALEEYRQAMPNHTVLIYAKGA